MSKSYIFLETEPEQILKQTAVLSTSLPTCLPHFPTCFCILYTLCTPTCTICASTCPLCGPCAHACCPMCLLHASENSPTWFSTYLYMHSYVPLHALNAARVLIHVALCRLYVSYTTSMCPLHAPLYAPPPR